jgi:uncharacterized protein (TIRG00374 family)
MIRWSARRHLLWLVAAVLMGVFIYWGRNDLERIRNLDAVMVVACFGCTAGIALTSAMKWKISLDCIGEAGGVRFRSLFYYFMMGRAVGLVMPMDVSDFGVRTMSLKLGHSVSVAKASYSVYLDRTFDVVIAGLFLVPSILFVVGAIGPSLGLPIFAVIFAAGLACFIFWGRQTMAFLRFLFRLMFKAVCAIPWVGRRVEFETESRVLAEVELKSIAPALYALSGLKFGFTAMRFVVIAAAMGMSLRAVDIVMFVPAAQFAALIALTPGGLGIADWSWSGLLYKIGAEKAEIVPYLVSLRLVISLSIVALAGVSRLLWRRPPVEEGTE